MFDLLGSWCLFEPMRTTTLIFCFTLFLSSCGQPDLSDPKVLDEILGGAVHHSDIQERVHGGDTLAFVSNLQNAFSGWSSKLYDNGQVRELTCYEDGKRNGLSVKWYENGRKNEEKNYRNGKLHGLTTRWWENGQKWYEETYENGEKVEEKFYD